MGDCCSRGSLHRAGRGQVPVPTRVSARCRCFVLGYSGLRQGLLVSKTPAIFASWFWSNAIGPTSPYEGLEKKEKKDFRVDVAEGSWAAEQV